MNLPHSGKTPQEQQDIAHDSGSESDTSHILQSGKEGGDPAFAVNRRDDDRSSDAGSTPPVTPRAADPQGSAGKGVLAAAAALAGKRHEGFMEKLSPSATAGWQQRYFVLENNQLMYFKEKDARAMFDELDEDDSGYLEEMEVASLCRTLGKKLNKKSMEKAMAEMDTSGDGKVSFEEFNAWWAQNAGKARAKSEPAGTIDLRQCKYVRTLTKREAGGVDTRSQPNRMCGHRGTKARGDTDATQIEGRAMVSTDEGSVTGNGTHAD